MSSRVGAAIAVVAVLLAACGAGAAPELSDERLACASAFETRTTIARGEFAQDDDEEVAELLLTVATLQFALADLDPQEPGIAGPAVAVGAATDAQQAVDAIVALTESCQRAEVPLRFDGGEHTTAACVQLQAADAAEPEDLAADDGAASRIRFTARYVEPRLDDLDRDLRAAAEELVAGAEAREPVATRAALSSAAERCAELR